jgi:RNA 3'-terminal phosphate cyclase (ATP)
MDGQAISAWWSGASRFTRRWVAHAAHGTIAAPHRAVGTFREPSTVSPSARAVTLDGSRGEGGGQILRTALTLSLITGRPFQIVRIRANRDKPGLRPQHLAAVKAAVELGHAEVVGAAVGSRELTFRPRPFEARDLSIDIGTAGATALVLQTLHLPISLRAARPVRLIFTGGTFNTSAPSFPFIEDTWRRHMARLGMQVALAMPRAGFYPIGGGRLEAWIEPAQPLTLRLTDRGALRRIRGTAGVANLRHNNIPERLRQAAEAHLVAHGYTPDIGLADWPGPGQGAAISLTVEHDQSAATFVGLGERGKPAEVVAAEAVAELLAFEALPGAFDAHSADQLLLPLAMAPGRSEYTTTAATDHLYTNAETIRAFLDRDIRIDAPPHGPARVVVG